MQQRGRVVSQAELTEQYDLQQAELRPRFQHGRSPHRSACGASPAPPPSKRCAGSAHRIEVDRLMPIAAALARAAAIRPLDALTDRRLAHRVGRALLSARPRCCWIARCYDAADLRDRLPDRRSLAGSRRAVDARSVALCPGRRPGMWHASAGSVAPYPAGGAAAGRGAFQCPSRSPRNARWPARCRRPGDLRPRLEDAARRPERAKLADAGAAGQPGSRRRDRPAELERMRRQMDYHLAQACVPRRPARRPAPGVSSSPTRSRASRAYAAAAARADRGVTIDLRRAPGHAARVEREDLDEMLGNISWTMRASGPPHACRYIVPSRQRSRRDSGRKTMAQGLRTRWREEVLRRGVRCADEASPGTGLGLAIVRTFAELLRRNDRVADSSHRRPRRATQAPRSLIFHPGRTTTLRGSAA